VTYTKYNPTTNLTYVGRTSGYGTPQEIVARRDLGHSKKDQDGYLPAQVDEVKDATLPQESRRLDPAYQAIRGREQQLIDFYGKAWSDTPGEKHTGNKIRGVRKANERGRIYHDAATREFGERHPYTGH